MARLHRQQQVFGTVIHSLLGCCIDLLLPMITLLLWPINCYQLAPCNDHRHLDGLVACIRAGNHPDIGVQSLPASGLN